MADTDDPYKRDDKGRIVKGSAGGPGRLRKRLTEDVEGFLYDCLNIQGARMLAECMTSATKLCGADSIEHPDWGARVHAFEVIRDTIVGKPAQVVTGEDGAPVRVDLDILGMIQRMIPGRGQ